MMLSIFSCASWPSVCLLWRNVYLGLPPFFWLGRLFFLVLSFMSCCYILEITPLSVASFANIFSHSEGCLFVLFMVSFAVQKLSSLIRSHLFIFVFCFLFFNLFIIYLLFLFLAVLGLRFCARAFSSCGEQGPLFIAMRGLLTIAASLVVERRLQTRRLSSCGSRA